MESSTQGLNIKNCVLGPICDCVQGWLCNPLCCALVEVLVCKFRSPYTPKLVPNWYQREARRGTGENSNIEEKLTRNNNKTLVFVCACVFGKIVLNFLFEITFICVPKPGMNNILTICVYWCFTITVIRNLDHKIKNSDCVCHCFENLVCILSLCLFFLSVRIVVKMEARLEAMGEATQRLTQILTNVVLGNTERPQLNTNNNNATRNLEDRTMRIDLADFDGHSQNPKTYIEWEQNVP